MVEGAADAAGLLDAAEGCWIVGYLVLLTLLGCCNAGVLHEAVGYWVLLMLLGIRWCC